LTKGVWRVGQICSVQAAADPVTTANGTVGLVAVRAPDGMIHAAQFDGALWTCNPTAAAEMASATIDPRRFSDRRHGHRVNGHIAPSEGTSISADRHKERAHENDPEIWRKRNNQKPRRCRRLSPPPDPSGPTLSWLFDADALDMPLHQSRRSRAPLRRFAKPGSNGPLGSR